MQWYLECLRKYFTFDGRARRKEYWFFILFNVLISIALAFVDGAMGTLDAATGAGLLGSFYSLAVLIPGIAVTIRRLHDTGRAGWWILLFLLPVLGALVLLVFMVFDSQPGSNEYGDNPKETVPGAA